MTDWFSLLCDKGQVDIQFKSQAHSLFGSLAS